MPTKNGAQKQSKGKKKSNKNLSNPPKPKVSYYCRTCKALFPCSKEQHDRIAHGPYATQGKPYNCLLCKKTSPSFKTADALAKHQAAVHHICT